MSRRKGIHIFLSTVCDVYQPVEKKYQITRQCLEVLRNIACQDFLLNIFLLTKSNMIIRDIDLLCEFPANSLKLGFSINTYQDEIAKKFEPCSPSPTQRLNAAKILKENGLNVGLLINPILPYFTEKDLKTLLDIAEDIKIDSVDFDMLNYINRHVGNKILPVYNQSGKKAMEHFNRAKYDPSYPKELQKSIKKIIRNGNYHFKTNLFFN